MWFFNEILFCFCSSWTPNSWFESFPLWERSGSSWISGMRLLVLMVSVIFRLCRKSWSSSRPPPLKSGWSSADPPQVKTQRLLGEKNDLHPGEVLAEFMIWRFLDIPGLSQNLFVRRSVDSNSQTGGGGIMIWDYRSRKRADGSAAEKGSKPKK